MVAPKYVPNHDPNELFGKYADRPSGSSLQQLPFGTWYVATDSDVVSLVTGEGSSGNVRRWIEFLPSSGIILKLPVQMATVAALAAYTVSADKTTITANAPGAIANIDGQVVSQNLRILLQNGASAIDNGIYVVTQAGSGVLPFILTRTPDWPVGQHVAGMSVPVEAGNFFAQSQILCTSTFSNDVVGTNNLTFAEQARALRTRANGAANLTAANCILADIHTLDTSGPAARGVALPVGSTVPANKEYHFCMDVGGAAAITVTPDGTDTINGVNAPVATSASLFGSLKIKKNPAVANDWIVLSRS